MNLLGAPTHFETIGICISGVIVAEVAGIRQEMAALRTDVSAQVRQALEAYTKRFWAHPERRGDAAGRGDAEPSCGSGCGVAV